MKIRFEYVRSTTHPELTADGKLGRVYRYRAYHWGGVLGAIYRDLDRPGGHWVYVHVFSAEAMRHREALALRRALIKQGGSI